MGGRSRNNRGGGDRLTQFLGLTLAAAVTPLLVFAFKIGHLFLNEPVPRQLPSQLPSISTALGAAFIVIALPIACGFVGSMLLLALCFGALRLLRKRPNGFTTIHFAAAGVAAGVMHVALAIADLRASQPPGLSLLLGTWFVRGAVQRGEFGIIAAPPIAGALAGLLYARVRSLKLG
jgi:hypothetical protein